MNLPAWDWRVEGWRFQEVHQSMGLLAKGGPVGAPHGWGRGVVPHHETQGESFVVIFHGTLALFS